MRPTSTPFLVCLYISGSVEKSINNTCLLFKYCLGCNKYIATINSAHLIRPNIMYVILHNNIIKHTVINYVAIMLSTVKFLSFYVSDVNCKSKKSFHIRHAYIEKCMPIHVFWHITAWNFETADIRYSLSAKIKRDINMLRYTYIIVHFPNRHTIHRCVSRPATVTFLTEYLATRLPFTTTNGRFKDLIDDTQKRSMESWREKCAWSPLIIKNSHLSHL